MFVATFNLSLIFMYERDFYEIIIFGVCCYNSVNNVKRLLKIDYNYY